MVVTVTYANLKRYELECVNGRGPQCLLDNGPKTPNRSGFEPPKVWG